MAYKVKQVIGHDTIQVQPEWRIWKLGKGGNLVKINGCQLSPGSSNGKRSSAKVDLFNLIEGKVVEIRNVYKVQGKTVTADVFIGDKHISEYLTKVVGLNGGTDHKAEKSLPAAEETLSENTATEEEATEE